jgi:hypothetical protein
MLSRELFLGRRELVLDKEAATRSARCGQNASRTSFKTRLRLISRRSDQCQWDTSEGVETTCNGYGCAITHNSSLIADQFGGLPWQRLGRHPRSHRSEICSNFTVFLGEGDGHV